MTADERSTMAAKVAAAYHEPCATSDAVTVTAPDHEPTRRQQLMLAAAYSAAIGALRDAERASEDDE